MHYVSNIFEPWEFCHLFEKTSLGFCRCSSALLSKPQWLKHPLWCREVRVQCLQTLDADLLWNIYGEPISIAIFIPHPNHGIRRLSYVLCPDCHANHSYLTGCFASLVTWLLLCSYHYHSSLLANEAIIETDMTVESRYFARFRDYVVVIHTFDCITKKQWSRKKKRNEKWTLNERTQKEMSDQYKSVWLVGYLPFATHGWK